MLFYLHETYLDLRSGCLIFFFLLKLSKEHVFPMTNILIRQGRYTCISKYIHLQTLASLKGKKMIGCVLAFPFQDSACLEFVISGFQ